MKESEKMKLGLWYDANYDEELLRQRLEAESLCFEYNHAHPKDIEKKAFHYEIFTNSRKIYNFYELQ